MIYTHRANAMHDLARLTFFSDGARANYLEPQKPCIFDIEFTFNVTYFSWVRKRQNKNLCYLWSKSESRITTVSASVNNTVWDDNEFGRANEQPR